VWQKSDPNFIPAITLSTFELLNFSWQVLTMENGTLKKQVELLKILAEGCKKHPAYRAIRPATGRCEPCVKMWKARLALQDLQK